MVKEKEKKNKKKKTYFVDYDSFYVFVSVLKILQLIHKNMTEVYYIDYALKSKLVSLECV